VNRVGTLRFAHPTKLCRTAISMRLVSRKCLKNRMEYAVRHSLVGWAKQSVPTVLRSGGMRYDEEYASLTLPHAKKQAYQ
jgi:hypothetical protein